MYLRIYMLNDGSCGGLKQAALMIEAIKCGYDRQQHV
jgi:hypothetical protein